MLVKLKDLLLIKNGSDYKHLPAGDIPVIGTGGVMLYVNKFLYDKEAILLPRKGSLNNIMYINKPFWTVDTMFYAIPNSKIVNAIFLYYRLKLFDFTKYDVGSTIPSMTASLYYSLSIDLPPLEIQNKIASILSSIDVQIERNSLMVKKLQVLTHSAFDYFSKHNNYENKIALNDIIVEKNKSQIQVNNIIDGSGNIPFFTSGESILYTDNSLTNGFNIFLSTGGNAKVQSYYGNVSYSTDTWCITSKNNLQYYLYGYLKHIENQMDKLYFHGTGLKHLQKPLFLKSIIEIPNNSVIQKFNLIVEPMYIQISKLTQSNVKLQRLKNKLLPLLINQQLL